jgi:hypothetical protein
MSARAIKDCTSPTPYSVRNPRSLSPSRTISAPKRRTSGARYLTTRRSNKTKRGNAHTRWRNNIRRDRVTSSYKTTRVWIVKRRPCTLDAVIIRPGEDTVSRSVPNTDLRLVSELWSDEGCNGCIYGTWVDLLHYPSCWWYTRYNEESP